MLVVWPRIEVAILIEEVVNGCVDRGEFLECFHLPEAEHGPFTCFSIDPMSLNAAG